jgi:hypothetical protein
MNLGSLFSQQLIFHNCILKKQVIKFGLPVDSGHGPVARYCHHGNETLDSIKSGEYFVSLTDGTQDTDQQHGCVTVALYRPTAIFHFL